mmetsp:Transcript_56375/g.115314  ORF Transcript_56375/g.115314 Transcript_56375/m.115314 type:complete len:254 (+) Transcript_56375:121-882(+)|eukprot:CAMPEP_0181292744 /NCGR_PEP_ID=MMETSP1101-20121128/2680_1 /TAXON_ID=46948 /ORGANISM="Rhodomonas abbreviata, Strain Caron Lab Isolate" /LENGTH=253 /DNA_ID=CAMNT_0023397255 /DNA_START=104 /DNA_END=865 /DNA_ORIENTATION=-
MASDLPFDPNSGSLDALLHFPVDKSKFMDVSKVPDDMTPAVLISCGSFSPPTVMHMRIFEAAKDFFISTREVHKVEIIGGFVSPVHPGYGKSSLVAPEDRLDMCRASLQSSEWVLCDDWETKQNAWTRTRLVLDRYRMELNKDGGRKIKVMLLCGSDILDSMIKPGVWSEEDLHAILGGGVACIKREGTDPEAIVFDNDLLYKYRDSIYLCRDPIQNNVSSTAVRRAIKRGLSIKYLVLPEAEKIIRERGLFT